MWKQKFPVRFENVVERREGVEEWVVTLAFPNQERLHRGRSLPGVYAFLPTEMVTNFPFIIQADFVLASSRETILLDNKWNQGILECVPSAFMSAFKTLVIGSDQAPISSLPPIFRFLPTDSSPFEKLNYAHFLYHSFSKRYISNNEVRDLCGSMPLVDNYGHVTECRKGVLVPAHVSKWADLIVSNPWRNEHYVELGKEYLQKSCYAGQNTDSGKLIEFLKSHAEASDIPDIYPPNAGFAAVDTPLTKENALLLLAWIQNLKHKGVRLPERFLKCIKEGNWLKVTAAGRRAPSKCFVISSSLGRILQSGSALVDIPLIDESFYGPQINKYLDELKTIGVMTSCEEACKFIGTELMTRAASLTLTKRHIFLMLDFIQHLRQNYLPSDHFVNSIKDKSWLVKLILGFLSCSSLKMEPNKRHEAVQGLLNLSFFETADPVTVSYSLPLSSGNVITKYDNRMVRWERQSSKFFTQMNWQNDSACLLKYATYFSEAISEGVLCENHDHVPELSKLITLAFLLKFDDEAIEFLMESGNLHFEDDEFLNSSFPSD